MWRYNNTNEIYHHGILGQKWGVRRYQNKDGSLTPAGKRKAAKMKDEYTALTGKRLIRKPTKKEEPKKIGEENASRKQIKEMSDTEVTNRIERLRKEKELAGLQSETASKGEKFISTVGKQVIAPAAIEAGKRVLTNWLEKQGKALFGLDPKETRSVYQELKEEAEMSKWKKQIQQDKEWFEKRSEPEKQNKNKAEKAKSEFVGNVYDEDSKTRKSSKDTVIDAESVWEDYKPNNSTALVPYRRRK